MVQQVVGYTSFAAPADIISRHADGRAGDRGFAVMAR